MFFAETELVSARKIHGAELSPMRISKRIGIVDASEIINLYFVNFNVLNFLLRQVVRGGRIQEEIEIRWHCGLTDSGPNFYCFLKLLYVERFMSYTRVRKENPKDPKARYRDRPAALQEGPKRTPGVKSRRSRLPRQRE
jgi:hypothetical protein